MEEFQNGLGDAWASVATFLPKLLGFLLILVIGYFVAKLIEKAVDGILERVGFDKAVERGGVKKALAKSKFDASSILAKVAFYAIFLFVLQLAFSVFGQNPISELITGVIAYLPNIFAAVLIIVVASAIAAGVKEIVESAVGGLSYGKGLAIAASMSILVLGVFAALDQLNIAENIVNTLFTGLVVTIAGSAIVAVGGGGIKTMQRYWERAANKVEDESENVKSEMDGAGDRVKARAEQRKEQMQGAGATSGSGSTQQTPTYGQGSGRQ